MMRDNTTKKLFKERLSLIAVLVVMIFVILFVSSFIAGVVSYLLVTRHVFPVSPHNMLEAAAIYMAVVSLLIGTILARFIGARFLRKIHALADATKQVALGNFDVRMEVGGAREIDVISNSFNDMVKELSNTETLRSDFVNNISHEFKTPVSSIRGFARRLKKNSLSEKQRNEYLDIIISESERLTHLSSKILLLSSLENTEILFEKTLYPLDEQLRRTVLLMEPQLKKKKLEVDITLESVSITANEEMMSELWINLLSNAIKFSPEGETITVCLTKTDGIAEVIVSDNGVGISDENKKYIFDKFYQGDKSRSTEGNGLGLPLAKRIVEIEKGEIMVDSKSEKGAAFIVRLPVSK